MFATPAAAPAPDTQSTSLRRREAQRVVQHGQTQARLARMTNKARVQHRAPSAALKAKQAQVAQLDSQFFDERRKEEIANSSVHKPARTLSIRRVSSRSPRTSDSGTPAECQSVDPSSSKEEHRQNHPGPLMGGYHNDEPHVSFKEAVARSDPEGNRGHCY